MSDEITVQQSLQVKNSVNIRIPTDSPNATFDQAAVGGPTPGVIDVGTLEESTTFPELTTLGWFILQNLDPTNYVQWGFSTGVYGGRCEPGETAGPFRLEPGATLFYKADTAACKCMLAAFED